MRRLLALAAWAPALLIVFLPASPAVHAQSPDYGGYRPQFPPIGAYDTVGGRGGAIYLVDTLEWRTDPAARCTGTCGGLVTTPVCDTVTCYRGSLGTCLAASGARYCLPAVSGYIDMPFNGGFQYGFHVLNSNLTVAGQTAPSPGLTLRYAGLAVGASDVVLQHLRFRGGTYPNDLACSSGFTTYADTWPPYHTKIVFDHLSAAWAQDDNIGVGSLVMGDIMVWRSNASEPLNYRSSSEAPPTCSGGVVEYGGTPGHCLAIGAVREDTTVFVGESVVSNCIERYMWSHGSRLRSVLVNNIVHGFDAGNTMSMGSWDDGLSGQPWYASMVGNRFIANAVTCALPATLIIVQSWHPADQLYRSGNSLSTIPDCRFTPGELWIVEGCEANSCLTGAPPADAPLPTGYVPRASNEAMEAFVLANVGARPLDRDSADTRIIDDIAARTVRSVHSQNDVGGWPELANNVRALAIPANPHAIAPGQTFRTNIEIWLETLAAELEGTPGGLRPPRNVRVVTSE
jgi:hypothetical protein